MHKIPFLNIENLEVSINKNKILKRFNLKIYKGEIHTIMGPNGSGKSSLSKVLSGHPDYKSSKGRIMFKNIDITYLEPEQRSHMGMFLAFQYPVEIPGVSVTNFIKTAINETRKSKGLEDMPAKDMLKLIREKAELLEIDRKFLSRSLNEGFSGGEKKRNEIFQMAMLEPKLAILDETDSGLDIDALKIVSKGVNSLANDSNAVILITHYQRLLDYIEPTFIHVMQDGKIIKTGDKSLAKELESKGYDWLK